jgi:hypothetical protein
MLLYFLELLRWPGQAAIFENEQSAITPELMAGSSPNFN